jgi:hypothetical protein
VVVKPPGFDPAQLNHLIMLGAIGVVSVLYFTGTLDGPLFLGAVVGALTVGYFHLLHIHHTEQLRPVFWIRCPGALKPDLVGKMTARCPSCGWTYITAMDDPLLPQHWVDGRGNVQLRPESR